MLFFSLFYSIMCLSLSLFMSDAWKEEFRWWLEDISSTISLFTPD